MTLPANISQMKDAIRRTQQFAVQASQGQTYMKMDKGGNWTIGSDAMPVEDGAEFAVNPESFATGYSAFDNNNQRVGEEMAALTADPIILADLPHVNGPWLPQLGMQVKCVSGEDTGLEANIYQRSRGGMESMSKILDAIMTKLEAGDEKCIPVIVLGCDKYRHKLYGMTYFADFEIVRWIAADGLTEDGEEFEEVEEAPKPKPTRKRAAPKAEQAEEEAEEEAPAPQRRRRRA